MLAKLILPASLCAAFVLGTPLRAAADGADAAMRTPAVIADAVDRWIAPYVSARDFSGVVLIAHGEDVIIERAWGEADFARHTPNTPGTRFRVASLSKTFTAAAIEMLVTAGKLKLSDALGKYVEGIPNGDAITVEQLLLHASGVGVLDSADVVQNCLPSDELLRRLRLATPLFEPGKGDEYSNEGYFLLAMIVETVAGISYDRFLGERILGPLGMRDTGTACQSLPAGDAAVGHTPGAASASVQRVAFDEAMWPGPGSVYSTARDLHRWLRAVDTDERFRNASYRYPYGWGRRNYSGRDLIEQSGIVEGFDAHMALYPREHIYVVVLSNVQSGFLNRIPKDVEAALFGGETSRPPEVRATEADPAELETLAGSYSSDGIPLPQKLVLRDGILYLSWGENPLQRVLTPVGRDEFFLRSEYAKVRCDRDASGRVARCAWQWPEGEPLTFVRR